MKLSEFDPSLDPSELEDCEVVGVSQGTVIHFNAEEGSVYNSGLTREDWLNGHAEAWCMTESEARRVGVEDYDAYVERITELNPRLVGREPEGLKP